MRSSLKTPPAPLGLVLLIITSLVLLQQPASADRKASSVVVLNPFIRLILLVFVQEKLLS